MRGQLISNGDRAAEAVQMFPDEAAGFIRIFVKELCGEEGIADDVP